MKRKILGWLFIPFVMVGLIVAEKTKSKLAGFVAGLMVFLVMLTIYSIDDNNSKPLTKIEFKQVKAIETKTIPTPKPTKRPKTPEQIKKEKEAARLKKIEKQFSVWDGSHDGLTKIIKLYMNDPTSYEHVDTRYWDNGNSITVLTRFRGSNAFGGIVVDYIKAEFDLDGNLIKIMEG